MTTFSMRLSHEELQQLKNKAVDNGFNSLSTYLKYVGMNSKVVATVPKVGTKKDGSIQIVINGEEIAHGKVKETLRQIAKANNIDITAPTGRSEYNTRELGKLIIKELN